MQPDQIHGAWETALQFGAVGTICFFAVVGLIWFVVSQKKDLKESNTKVISILETTVKESNNAKNNLADAIRSLPCAGGLPCQMEESKVATKIRSGIAGIRLQD